jgi:cytochrome b561
MKQFVWSARILHWLMAAMLIAMLFIGVRMVSSLGDYHRLVSIHRPLGIGILLLAVVRIVNRLRNPPPDFLPTMSATERFIASQSERLLYALMVALPLVGWSMLSAGGYPVVLFGSVHLPHILPESPRLFSLLRPTHTVLAYLLFFTFVAHLAGVLFHTVVLRDGLILRMVPWKARPPESPPKAP